MTLAHNAGHIPSPLHLPKTLSTSQTGWRAHFPAREDRHYPLLLVLRLLLPLQRLRPIALPPGSVCALVCPLKHYFLNIRHLHSLSIVCIRLLVSFLEREQTQFALHT
jgi:hypothetical protein